jgi:hypothetical protein
MRNEPVKLPNAADERIIDACMELLDAGRPLSEIIIEAKRWSGLKTETGRLHLPSKRLSSKPVGCKPLPSAPLRTKPVPRNPLQSNTVL